MLPLIKRFRFSALLAFIGMFMVSLPLLARYRFESTPMLSGALSTLFFSLLLISAISSISDSRRAIMIAITLIISGIALKGFWLLFGGDIFYIGYHLFNVIFLSLIIYYVSRYIFQSRRINADMIYASLCTFLLLGLLWAILFSLTDHLFPSSFYIANAVEGLSSMHFGDGNSIFPVYYSFVTLTTLGYGDIFPLTSIAKMLAVTEALTGQLYLVVIVARLVGLHIVHENESNT
jgi:hypothetical protein